MGRGPQYEGDVLLVDKVSEALVVAHQHNPQFRLGKLMEMAASIGTATLKQRTSGATDEELLFGLRALVPDPEDGL